MKQIYELTVILSPQLSADTQTKTLKSLETLIEKAQGKVVRQDDWGKKTLAYPIAKQTEGVYKHWNVELPTEGVTQVVAKLRHTEGLLRHLIVLGGT